MAEMNEQGSAQEGQGGPPQGGAPGPEGGQGPQASPGPRPAGAEGPLPTFMWSPREEQFLGEMKSDDKTMGMLCHLLGIFTGFIGPLIIWLMKKDQSPYVDTQGKEALNFQISMGICFVAGLFLGSVTSFLCFLNVVFFLATAAVYIFDIVMSIIASMKANEGKIYRYPLCIRFIK